MTYTADEFGRESQYIETLIWESLCIERDQRVLFCGYGPDAEWVRRAIRAGATVHVIEHRDASIRRFGTLDATLVRGSTSVIPAKENAYDVAVSFHYLHETDPFFHGQIVSELARVAKRVAIVEPSPPSDPLGKRIALLYSQAKRELGQFEYYQPIEYWKRLLQAVKAEVVQHVFAFSKVPPAEYLADTIALLLDTMEVEEVPAHYLEELREIARRPGAKLLPQARFVLIGATVGSVPAPHFSKRVTPPPAPKVAPQQPAAVVPVQRQQPAEKPVTRESGYEFPPVDPPSNEPPPAFVPGLPFGAPAPPTTPPIESPAPPPASTPPFGAPFAIPEIEPAGGWQWEPPEGGGDGPPGFS